MPPRAPDSVSRGNEEYRDFHIFTKSGSSETAMHVAPRIIQDVTNRRFSSDIRYDLSIFLARSVPRK